jgi:CrcB protein
MLNYFIVFLGAGIGGAMRHGINQLAPKLSTTTFPFGTMIINILGSLAMGLLVGYFATRLGTSQYWRLFLATGILGGFTTFSTFSLEAVLLSERGEMMGAAMYVLGSVALGIIALIAGLAIMRTAT